MMWSFRRNSSVRASSSRRRKLTSSSRWSISSRYTSPFPVLFDSGTVSWSAVGEGRTIRQVPSAALYALIRPRRIRWRTASTLIPKRSAASEIPTASCSMCTNASPKLLAQHVLLQPTTRCTDTVGGQVFRCLYRSGQPVCRVGSRCTVSDRVCTVSHRFVHGCWILLRGSCFAYPG